MNTLCQWKLQIIMVKSADKPSGPPGWSLPRFQQAEKNANIYTHPPGWDASPLQGYPQHKAANNIFVISRSLVRSETRPDLTRKQSGRTKKIPLKE